MPLPNDPSMRWPPLDSNYLKHQQECSAWYSGDPQQLLDFYGSVMLEVRPRFWSSEVKERRTMVHLPVAGDIASKSAGLLFSEAPKFLIPDAHAGNAPDSAKATQDRLLKLVDYGGIHNRLIEAGELQAALGGVFLKVDWDEGLVDRPFLTVVPADAAVPEFRWGMLQAVTFWRVVEDDGDEVWRHLERHELDNGEGVILHGLYRGSWDRLGRQLNLRAHRATANLQPVVRPGVKGLLAGYIPNRKPNRRFRTLYPELGQSDYSDVIGLMDALDETWSSWMRDIRLGKARIFVPETFLEIAPGGGFRFDLDQEAYVTYQGGANLESQKIDFNQFAIRVEEHERTCSALLMQVVQGAGYSPSTFGLVQSEGRTMTATEVVARERGSLMTRGLKERYWAPELSRLMRTMLQIDRLYFNRDTDPNYEPSVQLADSVVQDEGRISESVQRIAAAGVASTETLVRMLHPDWTDDQIRAEVEKIREERGLVVPDPMQVGELP